MTLLAQHKLAHFLEGKRVLFGFSWRVGGSVCTKSDSTELQRFYIFLGVKWCEKKSNGILGYLLFGGKKTKADDLSAACQSHTLNTHQSRKAVLILLNLWPFVYFLVNRCYIYAHWHWTISSTDFKYSLITVTKLIIRLINYFYSLKMTKKRGRTPRFFERGMWSGHRTTRGPEITSTLPMYWADSTSQNGLNKTP